MIKIGDQEYTSMQKNYSHEKKYTNVLTSHFSLHFLTCWMYMRIQYMKILRVSYLPV